MIHNQQNKSLKPWLVVDVSPLDAMEYTGISNVVYELSRRFLSDKESAFDIKFSVFYKSVESRIIEKCLQDRCGRHLRSSLETKEGIEEIVVDGDRQIEGRPSFGLFFHRKPNHRVFRKDSRLFYDFTFLLTPECHTLDNINFLAEGLPEQVASTDLFFCISEATANDLRWLFDVPKRKTIVTLLGNNVDKDLVTRARNRIRGREIEPYILTLGTIEPRKNIALILEWLKRNPSLLSKFRFVFAGRYGWGPSFGDYVIKYGLADYVASGRIVHLGYVDEALKATLMTGARAMLYPSFFEGFGLPVLEAMESGAPVLASCSTSIPEVLGNTGYYFDPHSVESLDKAFAAFLFDQYTGRLELVRQKAKERASEFSYDRTYSTMVASLVSNFLS